MFSSLWNREKEKGFCSAIVLGAGQGTRMNSTVRKQFIEVLGKPVIVHTLQAFEKCDLVDEVILVTADEDIVYANDLVKSFALRKVKKIVTGGKRRQDSVFCGLKEVAAQTDIVAVHDGARPLIKPSDIQKVIEDAIQHGSAILGVRAKDTIKIADEQHTVLSTPNRNFLYSIQTPQVFHKNLLTQGYENVLKNNLEFTDDASLVEAVGVPVKITEGHYDNIKITTQEDLIFMKALLECTEE